MAIKVILFGQLRELAGLSEVVLDHISDTDQAWQVLLDRYPAIDGLSCRIAVDQQLIQSNTLLKDGQELAVLPPYSGG